MMNCGSGGNIWKELHALPWRFITALDEDPFGLALVMVAFGAWIASDGKARKTIPALAFLLTAGVTGMLFLSPGIWFNHFIDVEAAALIFIAVNAKGTAGAASTSLAAVVPSFLAAIGHTVYSFRPQDHKDQRRERGEILATSGKGPGPLLTETNMFSAMDGETSIYVGLLEFSRPGAQAPRTGRAIERRFVPSVIPSGDTRQILTFREGEDGLSE